jgi:hypothetical protein
MGPATPLRLAAIVRTTAALWVDASQRTIDDVRNSAYGSDTDALNPRFPEPLR